MKKLGKNFCGLSGINQPPLIRNQMYNCVRRPTYRFSVPSWKTRFLMGLQRLWNPLTLHYWPNKLRNRKMGFDPMLISLVKRIPSSLLAQDIVAVQPMTGPTFHKTYRTKRQHQWFLEDALFHGTKYQQHIYVDFSKQVNPNENLV